MLWITSVETVAKLTSPQGEGTSRVGEEPGCGWRSAATAGYSVVDVCAPNSGYSRPYSSETIQLFPFLASLTSLFRPLGTILLWAGRNWPPPAEPSAWSSTSSPHPAGHQHLEGDPPQPPVSCLAQTVVLLLFGELALEVGTLALAGGIGLAEDLRITDLRVIGGIPVRPPSRYA